MFGLMGKKKGMTQVFAEDGTQVSVTVVEAGPCPVLQKKTAQLHGYDALQLGYEECREKVLDKGRLTFFKKLGKKPHRYVREFRIPAELGIAENSVLTVAAFRPGDLVHVSGVTKGRGFQGVIKRHGKAGGPAAHGSGFHRTTGSIGMRTWPGRVFKNTRLPGHMGANQVTIKNLEVIAVRPAENVLLIRGALPGARESLVEIIAAIPDFKESQAQEAATPETAMEAKKEENVL